MFFYNAKTAVYYIIAVYCSAMLSANKTGQYRRCGGNMASALPE